MEIREWLLAEAFEAGAGGAEETERDGRFRAEVFATAGEVEAVRTALVALEAPEAFVGEAEPVPAVDWSEAWKEGLEAWVVSPRLVVRPPFVEHALGPGQREIVIEPGQAFGTGGHASTRLCLAWLDALIASPDSRDAGDAGEPAAAIDRVLDVGTGSGVLALAAAALGADGALGFDLDPVAVEAAEVAARVNGLADRVRFCSGDIETAAPLADGAYPIVVANLLKKEMLPIAAAIAARVAPGGHLVLAGLLVEDRDAVDAAFSAEGLTCIGERGATDAIGHWIAPCWRRPAGDPGVPAIGR